ncbi:hypothetical protein DFP73DRAFT_64054 [Morchella snyderi]|nr:hypothetical protein DFP73DRAFT_64054 [Morchella snyderi]
MGEICSESCQIPPVREVLHSQLRASVSRTGRVAEAELSNTSCTGVLCKINCLHLPLVRRDFAGNLLRTSPIREGFAVNYLNLALVWEILQSESCQYLPYGMFCRVDSVHLSLVLSNLQRQSYQIPPLLVDFAQSTACAYLLYRGILQSESCQIPPVREELAETELSHNSRKVGLCIGRVVKYLPYKAILQVVISITSRMGRFCRR